MNELKPCPFCGGEAKVKVCDESASYCADIGTVRLYGIEMTHFLIRCGRCRARTQVYLTRSGAFNAWNRRADNDRLIAEYPNRVLCSKGLILTKSLAEYDELINDIASEAIKEFAERLIAIYENDKTYDRPTAHTLVMTVFRNIDNIVKEMTEGDK